MWQRFDVNLYVTIAEHGYGTVPGDTHFPPLFPLLTRLLQPIFGSAFLAGLVVSNAATLYMLKLLGDIFMEWGGLEIGKRAVQFFVIYPAFFFFFSAYSEAVFLVCVLLSLRTMRSRAWAWSAFWTFCAIPTRLQGVALLVPMVYLMWSDPPFLRRSAHWAGLVLAGMGGLLHLSLRRRRKSGRGKRGQSPFAFLRESAAFADCVARPALLALARPHPSRGRNARQRSQP